MTAAPDVSARTRSAIVDSALTLASAHRYTDVTVAEVAAAAGVEHAEFLRFFDDLDAVVLSVLQDMLATAAAYVPSCAHEDPRQTLRAANAAMLHDIVEGNGVVSVPHLTAMVAVVTGSPRLQKRASELRQRVMGRALADHLGLAPGDRRVRRAVVSWSAVVAASYHADLGESRTDVGARRTRDRLVPQRMTHRLEYVFGRILGSAR